MNQCVCRFFGILLVVVIYTAFTVEGVGFGVSCASGEICDDPNTVCPGSGTLECGCAATYYRKSDNSACALIVTTLSGFCDIADTAAEQCSYANTECTADGGVDKCLCKATHYSDGTDCQTRIAYESACSNTVTDTTQCAVTNQECSLESGTTNYKCQCTAGYYGDGTGCAAKIAFGGDCTGGAECVGDNTECDGGTTNCVCSSTYYRNSGNTACVLIVTTLTGVCDTTDTATEQCSYANTECTADGGGGKCLCKATHYSDGTNCQPKIALNTACTASPTGQCTDSLAACDGTALLCKCTTGNFEKNDGTCAVRIANLEDACVTAETASDQCAIADSECRADQCLCKDTHYKTGTTCTIKIALNTACTTSPTGQCADSLAACDGTALLCKCTTGNFEKNDGTCAGQIPNLEDACVTAETASDQCAIADSECRTDQCLCKDTHYKTGTTCTIRKNPDETACVAGGCVTHATCDTSASPTICECDAGYTASPTSTPTMCSSNGEVKLSTPSYIYVVPIIVSMFFLLR